MLYRFKDSVAVVVRWLPMPLGLILQAYVTYRAVHLSMTHDEASTYLSYVPRSVWEIVTYAQPTTANNHILNTLLIKLMTQFGDAEWLIRLPNLLAGGGYLVFAYFLSRRLFRAPGPILLSFILLTCNAYLLDFFSLARGYGLSMCFLMGSLYFFQRFLVDWRSGHWWTTLGLALLAVYSNFTLLNYFACLLAVGFLALWMREGRGVWRSPLFRRMVLADLAAATATALLVTPAVYTLVSTDELYFAGQHGFFRDTYFRLVRNFLYHATYLSSNTVEVFFVIGLGLQLLLLGVIGKRGADRRWRLPGARPVLYGVLLVLAVVSLVMQFHLLGTQYVRDRMALYFYPLLAIVSALGLVYLPLGKSIRRVIWVAASLLMLNHFFVRSANLDHTYEWAYDRNTRAIMTELNELGTAEEPVRFGGPGLFQPAMLYYHSTDRFPHIEPIRWDPEVRKDTFFHFYLITNWQFDQLHPAYEVRRWYGEEVLMERSRSGN